MITAVESNSARLRPYLANRVGEVDDYIASWLDKYPDLDINPLLHMPGTDNVADLATRG